VLELPTAIAIAAQSGKPFDGYVALGCVLADSRIAGTLYEETVRALMQLGSTGLPIGNGIVLAADEGAALDQAQTTDIGGDAARASISLVTLAQRLGTP
jgi:6,7-dimethyl-8-ribityllumazine synthase